MSRGARGGGGTLCDALRGALGFLTRFPVTYDDAAWTAFTETPAAFPLVGYAVGLLAAAPAGALLLVGAPRLTVAAGYLLAVYLVTGVHHADGVADLGDAAAIHGGPEARREVLKDTAVGVGAVLAVALLVVGLALGSLAVVGLPTTAAVGLLVAAEVGAKFGMAAVACFGTSSHDGLGSRFTRTAGPRQLFGPAVAALPATLLTFPSPAAIGALVGGLAGALIVLRWSVERLGGTSGDVFGAANELGRVATIHVGAGVWVVA